VRRYTLATVKIQNEYVRLRVWSAAQLTKLAILEKNGMIASTTDIRAPQGEIPALQNAQNH
jgi:hypothetical protein